MNKRILLVAIAVVLAAIGAIAVYSYGHNADQRAVAESKPATVLVAGKRVPVGTSWAEVVKDGYLKPEKLPADSVPASALSSTLDAAIGQDAVAESDIAPGQIVLREAFGTKAAQTGVLAIPKGMIAVSVSLASNADVANYVGPGAEVVIFQTANIVGKDKPANISGAQYDITKTLISRAAVLATSQAVPTAVAGNATSTTGGSSGSVLVTFALSQADSERVIEGQANGSLYLGLLSPSSVVSANDPGISNVVASLHPTPIFVK